jgi:hypothetical protein
VFLHPQERDSVAFSSSPFHLLDDKAITTDRQTVSGAGSSLGNLEIRLPKAASGPPFSQRCAKLAVLLSMAIGDRLHR